MLDAWDVLSAEAKAAHFSECVASSLAKDPDFSIDHLSSAEVQAAVGQMLPGELGKHAVSEGTKAVSSPFLHTTPFANHPFSNCQV